MDRFTDETALITGGGSGIGRATAERLASEGANVVVSDIDDDRGEDVVASIEADGTEGIWAECLMCGDVVAPE
ncbi:SDR family NAD(P)-dependent oxidoreductase [Haloarcula sebkhae]|uniref:SDR family NAD(P)-dependent oxidoreductase n=2 Tax=Haloarcula sebkhae TaxID=932660 RepID=A0ACC6VRY0_9EURY|nr:SDR family NAD(P)-dependent oxidoreductase [Haloarcula sebkhae]GGK85030.1 hypothetical protein GCM10009067_41410 [Haloarcula sebkhae]